MTDLTEAGNELKKERFSTAANRHKQKYTNIEIEKNTIT